MIVIVNVTVATTNQIDRGLSVDGAGIDADGSAQARLSGASSISFS